MTRYFRLFIRLIPLAFIPLLSGCVWVAATGAVRFTERNGDSPARFAQSGEG